MDGQAQKRIADLEEEVWWLKSELGIVKDHQKVVALCTQYACSKQHAHLVIAMYDAKGRVLTKEQLFERIPHPNEAQSPHMVDVLICKARKHFGYDAIETHWGLGFRLSERGQLIVETCLKRAA